MQKTSESRRLLYGLFIFPLLVLIGMSVLMGTVVLLTTESQTPESLIAGIKAGSQSQRWHNAYELSNELNRNSELLRDVGVMNEMIHIMSDANTYDVKTRAYMAAALKAFADERAVEALRKVLRTAEPEVQLFAMGSLRSMNARQAAVDIIPLTRSDRDDLRKMAAYALGAMQVPEAREALKPLLNDSVADVRWNAALGLAKLNDASGLPVLTRMADREALRSEFGFVDQKIDEIMIEGLKGLALVGDQSAFDLIRKISTSDPSLKVREVALKAMAAKGVSR